MMPKTVRYRLSIFLLFLLLSMLLTSCQRAYYGAMEKMGIHKRDIMVERVKKARDSQAEAKEQFKSALAQFNHVLNVKEGELQQKYETLSKEYEESEEKADDVSERIRKVEDVSEALFEEWQEEISQYHSDKLKQDSEKKLQKTKEHYKELISVMKQAEKKIHPVLIAFHDQVLYLKHNLNTQAITSLQEEVTSMEGDIDILIKDMEASIQEADSFIQSLQN
jgi:DNA-binding ferritin-like protein